MNEIHAGLINNLFLSFKKKTFVCDGIPRPERFDVTARVWSDKVQQ